MVTKKKTPYQNRQSSPHLPRRLVLVQEDLLAPSQATQKLDDISLAVRLMLHQQRSPMRRQCLPVVFM